MVRQIENLLAPISETIVTARRLVSCRGVRSGYTLLEVLIALTVLATAVVIVGPNLVTGLNRAGMYSAILEFDRELQRLRRRAYEQDVEIRLAPGGSNDGRGAIAAARQGAAAQDIEFIALDIGADWSYVLNSPVIFYPSGRCVGAAARLEKIGFRGIELQFDPRRCRFERQ